MPIIRHFRANNETANERLDTYAASKSGFSRSYIQKLIQDGLVIVNGAAKKANHRVSPGDAVTLTIPEEPELILTPEEIPLDIVWEDAHLVAVNKPPGMVVHPGAGNRTGTLVSGLLFRCNKLATLGAPFRPGVVHRLDKDTSGILIVAKTNEAYLRLQEQFKKRAIEKQYLALVYGNPRHDEGEISHAVGRALRDRKKMSVRTRKGREALTLYSVTRRFPSSALVTVRIITGRTHQIRVHFAALGHPVLGDRIYGKKTTLPVSGRMIAFKRQMLHARSLFLRHPVLGTPLRLTAAVPADMEKAMKELK